MKGQLRYWWTKIDCLIWGHVRVVEWDANYQIGYSVCEKCRKVFRKIEVKGFHD